tara:strand:+ start:160 stop:411 length:252 start_codon:yes stop_codon:yes gene_type:complete
MKGYIMIKAKVYDTHKNELIFVEQLKDNRLSEFTRVLRCYGSSARGWDNHFGSNLLWEQATKKAYDTDKDTRFYHITSQVEVE